MPEFVLNRNYTLATIKGHVIRFEKGLPTYVPPIIVAEAVAIGAVAVDGEVPDVLGPEAVVVSAPVGDERKAKLFEAFKALVARNGRNDFTGAGVPSQKAVDKLIGFETDTREILEAWAEYRVAQAEMDE